MKKEVDIKFLNYMKKTYLWMFLGVLITFVTSFIVSTNDAILMKIYSNSMIPIVFLIAQLAVVILFTWRLRKIRTTTAKILFLIYSLLTGISFSILSLVYTSESIFIAFATTCIFFGILVLIGTVTKKDFTKIGYVCFAGLIALIIFELFAILFKIPMNSQLISIIGIIIFIGLTIWDAQKTKKRYYQSIGNNELQAKMSIYSAFQLYLDFINLFLKILRLMNKVKN